MTDTILPPESLTPEMFTTQACLHEGKLAVVGPLWEFNPRFTWEMFLKRYKKNAIEALINLASSPPTASRVKFYSDIDQVRKRVDPKRMGHPFKQGLELHNWFRPRPASRYCIHFDLSEVKDPTGIAMAHWDFKSQRVYLDFVLEIIPSRENPIRIQALENFVYSLYERGFEIARASSDIWGSVQMKQNLNAKGIEAIQYSLDKTTEGHETFHASVFSGLLSFYAYEPLFECLDNLYWFKGGMKLNHLPGKKKDVADAAAGAVTQALKLEGFTVAPTVEVVDIENNDDDEEIQKEFNESPGVNYDEDGEEIFDEIFLEGDEIPDTYGLDPDDDGIPY